MDLTNKQSRDAFLGSEAVRSLLDDVRVKYADNFQTLDRILSNHDATRGLSKILLQMFSDRKVNWGRIIVALAFLQKEKTKYNDYEEALACFTLHHIINEWVEANGGFDRMLDYRVVPPLSSSFSWWRPWSWFQRGNAPRAFC